MKKMRRLLMIALVLAIASLSSLPAFADAPKAFQDSMFTRTVYMPNGAGPFHYYAQNDPVWRGLVYEAPKSPSQRPFGDGGCNPTSLAMVVASLVPTERLNLLGMSAARGKTFSPCACSINKHYCYQGRKDPAHIPTTLISGNDFATALPLALADFATGNNSNYRLYRLLGSRQGGNGGTSKSLFEPVAEAYGLSLRITRDMAAIYGTLDRGGMVIALCSGNSQIFSAGNGHYVVIASYDDEFLYVMDPFMRNEYPKDRNGFIEKIGEGILRVKRTSAKQLGFGTFALFEAAPEAYYASLPLLLNPYTREVATATVDGSLTAAATGP